MSGRLKYQASHQALLDGATRIVALLKTLASGLHIDSLKRTAMFFLGAISWNQWVLGLEKAGCPVGAEGGLKVL